ncbi:MAG: class I SAM-dependent rRNA methyltransferase [Rhizobiales bacterium]|nr:class I SAM-dependent rRNA methyltransferase [Hyphomicrobiales bacterium]OJY06740.1 MAG: SAM-dependent methyltransferase [Rhizobiales bacterium 63-22]
MKTPKGKGGKPASGGKREARCDAPQHADRNAAFRKPRPQFAKAPSPDEKEKPAVTREIRAYDGPRPAERLPVILETEPTEDYALIDSGNGLKLEQYGPYRIVRPEGQAIWLPSLPQKEWDKADAVFTGNTDEEGMGRWAFPKIPLGETWPMRHDGISFHGRFTSFRHVGVFPEQAAHWSYMDGLIRDAVKSGRTVKVLNLFGYTGLASLVAARAGAEVTHVDASKKAILWARENQEMAGLQDKPIRWICEDAMKFVAREERRGSFYDIILLDPPAYGRGPSGEVWQLFEHLPAMVDTCRAILTPKPLAVILTAYSIRASFFAIHELMRDRFTGLGGTVESGELILREQAAGRALSTSMFSRWVAK